MLNRLLNSLRVNRAYPCCGPGLVAVRVEQRDPLAVLLEGRPAVTHGDGARLGLVSQPTRQSVGHDHTQLAPLGAAVREGR